MSTRLSEDWNPSAYRQCTATGTLTSTASRPDHTCTGPIHDGAPMPGIRPYMVSADRSWSKASTTTTVASHALTAIGLENPATLIGKNRGSCTLPNTPSPMAASAPTTTATTTAMLPPELGGTVTGMRSVGGEVAAGGS
jgi:hypothetical protein